MSEFLSNGEKRKFNSYRVFLDVETMEKYEALHDPSPTLSKLLSSLLKDWVVTQELKQEFKRLG